MQQLNYLDESYSAALCPDPNDIVNGMVTITDIFNGMILIGFSVSDSTATYSCDSGFEFIGDAMTTCSQINVNFAEFQQHHHASCRLECSINSNGFSTCYNTDTFTCNFHLAYHTFAHAHKGM